MVLFAVLLSIAAWVAGDPPISDLRTVAERSDYAATSRYDDVRQLVDAIANGSKLVRVSNIGKTVEGREIPLVIIADPPIATPQEAAASGKLVVLAFGCIHAGEVDGKEGLLALMRNIVGAPADHPEELQNLVMLFVPIYNADGNERIGKDTRPGQVGPSEGQGIRENAAGLDLNRDYVKLEAPETRSLIKLINTWDPAIVIDTHTTNGSYHRYVLTYGGPKNPAGDKAIVDYVTNTMLPGIGDRVKTRHGMDTYFYGNFEKDHTVWEDYPDQPRFGASYIGLRNRIPILTEAYSYAPYRERVKAQEAFVGECLLWAAEKKAEVRDLLAKADERTTKAGREPGEGDLLALRSKQTAFDAKVKVFGWEEKTQDGRVTRTDTPKDYEVAHLANFIPDLSVKRPYAYVLPASAAAALAVLQRHGVAVDELREQVEVDSEIYTIEKVTQARGAFQGHHANRVEAVSRKESRTLEPGSFIVKTGQRLGTLACYLLEPQSDDGLTAWNLFDGGLNEGADFAVIRLPAPTPLLTVPARALPENTPEKRPITFEDLGSPNPPNLGGSPSGGQDWLADGERYRQFRDGKLRLVDARTGRSTPAQDPEPAIKALAGLATVGPKTAPALVGRASWNEARTAFFVEHENDLYYVKLDTPKPDGAVEAAAARLTSTPSQEEYPSFSPDGNFVAFVRDNDLWVVDVATRTERALTTGGTDLVRNAKANWVYYEEIFGWGSRVYWWSPDSTRLAYLRVDSTPTPPFAIVNNSQLKQKLEHSPYPKPGDPNPVAKIFTVSAAGGDPTEVDLSAYDPADMLVTRVAWRPDSSSFIACITNRVQNWMDVLAVPARGGNGQKLFRETTPAWVDENPLFEFFKDGSFLFASARSGWRHLYRYDRNGTLVKQVTTGEWECRGVERVDADAALVYITGTKDSPIAENLYRVSLDNGEITRLTTDAGSHRVTLSPKGDLFVDSWSSHAAPARVALKSLKDGSVLRVLDTNPVRDLDKYLLGESEMLQISAPDGFALEATLLKPPNFEPARKYPVWFMTYAGPHAPTIGDTWRGGGQGSAWDQALASAGFLVFHSDPRSASGKGAVSAWACYKQLGVSELKDIETAITWLTSHPWADPTRVGMAGHSYGGFMTSYAMTHSTLFAAGIAGAPVTDWHEYDSMYTERYMLTPRENPEGYAAGSVVEAAKNLHGRLLLAHGMIDDNVHLQNNTRLIRALQEANKPFEMMLYPDSRHGIGGKHYQQLQIDFILRTLGGSTPAGSESERAAPPPPTGP